MSQIVDLSGQKYGRLTVLRQGPDKWLPCGKRVITWDCLCDCGNRTTVASAHLRSGHTISCGCAHREQLDRFKNINLSHGRTRGKNPDKAYSTWLYIKSRCYNSHNAVYKWYGKKGIKLCEEWEKDPEAFCRYVETLERYHEPGTSIDRIDYQKGYEPGNIRWVSIKEQQRNKKNNYLISYNGETLCLKDWADRIGVNRATIFRRIERGWPLEDVLTLPATGARREKLKQLYASDLDGGN